MTSRLSLLHCIGSINPATGGPIEAVRQLSAVHQRQGHHIELASLDPPEAPWVQQSPIQCHALGPGLLGNFGFSPRYQRWIEGNASRFDAVIVHGLWQYHGIGVRQGLRRHRTPYFVYPHGMLDPWFKRTYPFKHLKKWLFWPWGEYRVLRDANGVLFTCEQEARLAAQSFCLYSTHDQVVSFGTAPPPAEARQQTLAFETRFPAAQGTRRLLFLGRVHEKKGVDLLLKAWAQVARTHPQALACSQLVMAGPADDAYGQAMKALAVDLGIASQVVWTGMLSGDEKWGAYRCSDAFVLASHQENFGISVVEALACAKPVLISRQVNIWREIDAAQAGWMVDDDIGSVAAGLGQWAQSTSTERAQMGDRAVALFQQRFHIEAAAKSLLDALSARA